MLHCLWNDFAHYKLSFCYYGPAIPHTEFNKNTLCLAQHNTTALYITRLNGTHAVDLDSTALSLATDIN